MSIKQGAVKISELQSVKGKFSLAGKKAIVTGGAGGIGRSTAAAMAELGGLDCVHSNAGIVANDDTVDMPFESWNRMVSVNFTGMFLVDQAAAVSLLTLVVRIFDAFNDPIIGSIADRTKSRLGRYRPWFMVGSIVMAILIVLQFACNPNWSMTLCLA